MDSDLTDYVITHLKHPEVSRIRSGRYLTNCGRWVYPSRMMCKATMHDPKSCICMKRACPECVGAMGNEKPLADIFAAMRMRKINL